MSEWKVYKISEIGKVVTGKTPSSKNPEEWGTLVAFVTPTDFDSYNKSIEGSIRYLSECGAKVFNTKLLPIDSVIVTCIGSQMGKVALNKVPCVTNQQINSIIPNENFNADFIYYIISSMQDYLRNLATGGSTMPIVNKSDFENIKISAPSLPTQTAIAEILSSLDEKIELNNKINQELETLAQTLFKQWFVDFEFPNENGEPYKSSGGEMVDSELGEIPKGWLVKRLDEISSEITRGYTTKYVEKSSIINLNQKVNRGVHLDKSNFKYYPNDTVVPENKFARQKDILINSLGQGTLGRIHFYKENSTNVVIDQHITILRGNNEQFLPEILYLMLTFNSNQKRLEEMVTGSTGMLMLNINKIREFKVIVPPIEHQKSLNNNFVPSFENINCNILENEQLSSLRDTLLPKLISGELEINETNN